MRRKYHLIVFFEKILRKDLSTNFRVERNLLLLPQIYNLNVSFIQKIGNMNFSFHAKFMFLFVIVSLLLS